VVSAIVALPIVLPPTVLGFYLLIALGPHSP
jgi:molybdate transport system permease protein